VISDLWIVGLGHRLNFKVRVVVVVVIYGFIYLRSKDLYLVGCFWFAVRDSNHEKHCHHCQSRYYMYVCMHSCMLACMQF